MKIAKFSTIFLSIVLGFGLLYATAHQHGSTSTKQIPVNLRIKDAVLNAVIEIEPETLNLRSKGRWITSFIELPIGYSPSDIDVSSIDLNTTIPAEVKPTAIGDYDSDGILDLMVKFNRTTVINYILSVTETPTLSSTLALTLRGKLNNGAPFEGTETIRVIPPMPRYESFMRQFPI